MAAKTLLVEETQLLNLKLQTLKDAANAAAFEPESTTALVDFHRACIAVAVYYDMVTQYAWLRIEHRNRRRLAYETDFIETQIIHMGRTPDTLRLKHGNIVAAHYADLVAIGLRVVLRRKID